MAHTDKLLERLIKRVNDSGTFLDITVFVGGAMITGRIAPRTNWLEGNITALQDTVAAAFADDFAQEGGSHDQGEYLLLSQAKNVYDGAMYPTTGGAFRVRLDEVQGWMIGRMEATRDTDDQDCRRKPGRVVGF